MTELTLKWICSAGGPLILMEEFLISNWNGINNSDIDFTSISDYARACDVEDYLGLINVAGEKALVLGGDPMQTSWLNLNENDGIIIRLNYAESLKHVEQNLKNIESNQICEDTEIEIMNNIGKFVLFDSSCGNNYLEESLEISLKCGKYRIFSFLYEPNDALSLLVHRMVNKYA